MNVSRVALVRPGQWWILFGALAVLPFMISRDSLWVDEGVSAIYASQPDFSSWWHYSAQEDMGGDAQQPLSMITIWLGGRLIGMEEWQLRSINLLWGAIAVVCLWITGRKIDLPWLPVLFVIQPFVWTYTDEARPYALQIACGAMLLLAFVMFLQKEARGWRWCIFGTSTAVFFCHVTMLAPIFLLPLGVVSFAVARCRSWKPNVPIQIPFALGLVALMPVGLYYVQAIRRGARGAQLWDVDLRYFGYLFYDLAGAAGIGPPNDRLRSLGRGVHQLLRDSQTLSQLACAAVFLVLVGWILLATLINKKDVERRNLTLILIAPVLLQAILFFMIGLALHKNFWPRHLGVALPFYVGALGFALQSCWRSGNAFVRRLPVVLVLFLICSSLRVRWSPLYRKEDYRWAAATALKMSREQHLVWWVANESVARYYGLTTVCTQPENDSEVFCPCMADCATIPLSAAPSPPDDILISRPEVHDESGAVRLLIAQNHYRLHEVHPSFEWWIR